MSTGTRPDTKHAEFFEAQCDAEDAILGAAFVDASCAVKLAGIVSPSDFRRPVEREIFRRVCKLYERSPDCDMRGIVGDLRKHELLDIDHNEAWIATLASRSNVNQAITHDAPELRRLANLLELQRVAAQAWSMTADPERITTAISGIDADVYSDAEKLLPTSVASLQQSYPQMRPPVVHGILRVGETANIIAPPKVGKSFLAGNLAWSVATGRPWLSHEVEQGRVLILDNELHPETLASRLTHMADKMQVSLEERDQVDVISLRGRLTPIVALDLVTSIDPGRYALVVLDALYRTIPEGTSENDNAGMMAMYNHLDALAERWQAAIVVVHHSSKGAQGDKALTDVGAGAGAISRAADTHIAIRPHETDGHHVLEAVTRSFKSPEPVSIAFEWPVWTATTLTPEVKRMGRQDTAAQAKADEAAMGEILDAIPTTKPIQQNLLIESLGIGIPRFKRLVGCLIKANSVEVVRRRKKGGKKSYVFYRKLESNSGCNSGCNSGTT